MLNQHIHARSERNSRKERRLWQDEKYNSASLGCHGCPDKAICGGLRTHASLMDCLSLCCGKPSQCDRVCKNNLEYVNRVREVGSFSLDNIPRTEGVLSPALPRYVPIVFHGSRLDSGIAAGAVAIPLYKMVNRYGELKFKSYEEVCEHFSLLGQPTIILTGTARDKAIERWWGFNTRRPGIIRALKAIGISLITSPNYSLFIDRPRWDDLHAIKRIAITHNEFLSGGMPAALHVNGRTERDFERWAEYLRDRPEITHLAYEFTTGTGWGKRKIQHARWLVALSQSVNHKLDIIVRGGPEIWPMLAASYRNLTILDTSVFMKTMSRRKAHPDGNDKIMWREAFTPIGAPLDHLFADNLQSVEAWIRHLSAPSGR